jgi:RNA polymerase sigma-70 factor (ECF subfamily)
VRSVAGSGSTDGNGVGPAFAEADDDEMIDGVVAGDLEALRLLFRRYAPSALALASAIVPKDRLAEAAVQETFVSLRRDAARYRRERGSVRSWIMSAVHQRAVELALANKGQAGPPAAQAGSLPTLRALPAEERDVIELMYLGGLTQDQVADRLGLPLETVRQTTRSGMRRLRTAFEA